MPIVTDKFIREHEAMVRMLENISGPGVSVLWGQGITINRPGKRWERPHHDRQMDDFKGIFYPSSASQDGSNKRWEYTMVPLFASAPEKRLKSGEKWTGWTSAAVTIFAYNYLERTNGATGAMGCGVTLNGSGYIEGTSLTVGSVPLNVGAYRVYIHRFFDEEAEAYQEEYWFTGLNEITGDCEPP